MTTKKWIALPFVFSIVAGCDRESATGFGTAESPPGVGIEQTVESKSSPQAPRHLAGVSIAAQAVASKLRLWHGGPATREPHGRPTALAPRPDAPAAARRAGVWLKEQMPESVVARVSRAAISQAREPFSASTFRSHLHTFEIGRHDDQSLGDYQLVLQEAADAARANQHVNYVPLLAARVQFETASEGIPRQYFALGPLRGFARSQLVTFGLRPEFVLTNAGPPPDSIELSVLDRTYTVPLGGQVGIAFTGAGTYRFTATAHFPDGSVHRSQFDFEIKALPDGSFFNSTVDSNGAVDFKIAASEG